MTIVVTTYCHWVRHLCLLHIPCTYALFDSMHDLVPYNIIFVCMHPIRILYQCTISFLVILRYNLFHPYNTVLVCSSCSIVGLMQMCNGHTIIYVVAYYNYPSELHIYSISKKVFSIHYISVQVAIYIYIYIYIYMYVCM